jgi:hypothetical protein
MERGLAEIELRSASVLSSSRRQKRPLTAYQSHAGQGRQSKNPCHFLGLRFSVARAVFIDKSSLFQISAACPVGNEVMISATSAACSAIQDGWNVADMQIRSASRTSSGVARNAATSWSADRNKTYRVG